MPLKFIRIAFSDKFYSFNQEIYIKSVILLGIYRIDLL